MSLIKASYTVHRSKCYAGQVADTSLYNVDGTTVGDMELPIGRIVAVKAVQAIEGHKVITLARDNSLPLLGVVIESHSYAPEGVYEEGCATNVMTHGRVWVPMIKSSFNEADVAYDKPVSANNDGIVEHGGSVKTGYKFTGEWHPSDNADYNLVKIQVLQSVAVPAP